MDLRQVRDRLIVGGLLTVVTLSACGVPIDNEGAAAQAPQAALVANGLRQWREAAASYARTQRAADIELMRAEQLMDSYKLRSEATEVPPDGRSPRLGGDHVSYGTTTTD